MAAELAVLATHVSQATEDPRVARRRRLLMVAALGFAFLFHVVLLHQRSEWVFGVPSAARAPRVDVREIDPAKLERIRRQWRAKERERQLLISKDKSKPTETEAPKDARYLSDRNRIVDKEQRARQTNVVPRAGAGQGQADRVARSAEQARREQQAERAARERSRPIPRLGDLGVPLPRASSQQAAQRAHNSRAAQASHAAHDSSEASQAAGGDQAILERDLPEGSQNILNTQESIYYSFYARLYEAIAPLWQSMVADIPRRARVLPGEYTTRVEVILNEGGELVAVEQQASSGIDAFDRAVQTSWQKVGRFPNPPKDLLINGLVRTGWTFTVLVGQGTGLQLMPPERAY